MLSLEHEVLLSLFHGRERDGVRLGEMALLAAATLADETQELCSDVILNAVTAAARVALEASRIGEAASGVCKSVLV